MQNRSPRALRLAAPSVEVERRGDEWLLRSGHALPAAPRCLGTWLAEWAERAPDRTLLAERSIGGGWRRLSYADALAAARSIGSVLLELGASAARPVMILSENSIDHALVQLGAMHAGIPGAPISTAYSLASADFARLRETARIVHPRVIFASDVARYGRALDAVVASDAVLVSSAGSLSPASLSLADLIAAPVSDALERAHADITPGTVCKILFTSGSTGTPKGVVNTQRMLCTNQEAIAALWPFLEDAPPVTVDWLPWSHTFGGNHNLNMMLRNGGTFYIDGGKPTPGLIAETVRNLAEIAPTVYFNVPRGFELLLPSLEADDGLRARFFSAVDAVFYAAAALPPATRVRLERVAERAGRPDVLVTSAWGSTETAPMATSAYFPTSTPSVIGLPAPGTEIKLAPVDEKLEIRVRGPNVTPGYWTPGGIVTPPPLDKDGFLPTGDAASFDDPLHPERGLVFEGRLGENFKLTSGTWVWVGQLRLGLLDACAPLLSDAVICGHDRDWVAAMVFVSPSLLTEHADMAWVRRRVLDGLRAHNAGHPASSTAVRRALLLEEPPSLDAGETTDKGYLNQRRVLDRRRATVERLYAEQPDADVLLVG